MEYPINSKIYKIVDYDVEEYTIVKRGLRANYILRNNITGRETRIRASTLETLDVGNEFSSYSFSKIYLLNMLENRLEMMLRKVSIEILQHRNSFNEKIKKYDNVKFIILEEENYSRSLATKAQIKKRFKNGRETRLL